MRTFKSMITQDNRPVEDGIDLALVFAEANKEKLLQFIKDKTSTLERIREERIIAQEKKAFLPGLIIAVISVVISGSAIFIGKIDFFSGIGAVGIVAGILFAVFAEMKKRKYIKELEEEQQRIEDQDVPDSVSHIGKMYCMVDVIPFDGGKMVVDLSGTQQKTEFVYPGIPHATEHLKEILETLKNLPPELPILLPPGPPSGLQGKEPLTGIEGDMIHILSLTRQLLDGKLDSVAVVPAFSSDSNVVHSLHSLSDYICDREPGIIISRSEASLAQSLESLKAINDNAKEIERQGGGNDENILRHVLEQMDIQITRTKQVRDHSLIDILEKNLDQLKPLYDYTLTRFYCPKCHKVPQHIAGKMPVPIDQLNEKPIEQLKGFYKSEEMLHFRKLADNIHHHLDRAHRNGENLQGEHYKILQETLNFCKNKIRELACEIEGADPKAEVHCRNAVLKYNTLHNHWKCQLCGETFTTEEAQWARMLKIKDDLILPVWDKLWLEKHDESMRIIREKETELRKFKELESKQLREEADVFTQEYREARNLLESANAQCQGTREQLERMINFFSRQNILSQDSTIRLRNDILTNRNGNEMFDQIIDDADQMETHLEQEPETVFLRRGQLIDYTVEVRNKRKYFKTSVQGLPMIETGIPVEENTPPEVTNV